MDKQIAMEIVSANNAPLVESTESEQVVGLDDINDEQLIYFAHEDTPQTAYKVNKNQVFHCGLLAASYLADFEINKAHVGTREVDNKIYEIITDRDNYGFTPEKPLIISKKDIKFGEYETDLMTQCVTVEHMELIMKWFEFWGKNINDARYLLEIPLVSWDIQNYMKKQDNQYLQYLENYYTEKYADEIKELSQENPNYLVEKLYECLTSFIRTTDQYMSMPYLSDKLYGYSVSLIKKLPDDEINKILEQPEVIELNIQNLDKYMTQMQNEIEADLIDKCTKNNDSKETMEHRIEAAKKTLQEVSIETKADMMRTACTDDNVLLKIFAGDYKNMTILKKKKATPAITTTRVIPASANVDESVLY